MASVTIALVALASALMIGTLISAYAAGEEGEVEGLDRAESRGPEAETKKRAGSGERGAPAVPLAEASPLGDGAVGELVTVTGIVVGGAGPGGFFLRIGTDQVLFVEFARTLAGEGVAVSVIGSLRKAESVLFQRWELEASGSDERRGWKLAGPWYIEASSVAIL